MNITEKIISHLKPATASAVKENREIQVYYTDSQYMWKDTRYKNTSSMWMNKGSDTIQGVADILTEHIRQSEEYMKEAPAYCDFSLTVTCPHCEENIDLLDQDKGYDHDYEHTNNIFSEWDNINTVETCCECGKKFLITEIQR